jgi:hypothetical protein
MTGGHYHQAVSVRVLSALYDLSTENFMAQVNLLTPEEQEVVRRTVILKVRFMSV